jgi:hypothetical protein
MHVTRHHPVFDCPTRIGTAEHTFRLNWQEHGATFQLRRGRIALRRADESESQPRVAQLSAATSF